MSDDELQIRERIENMALEHRDLDIAIQQLEEQPYYDQLHLRRMKKRKLLLS